MGQRLVVSFLFLQIGLLVNFSGGVTNPKDPSALSLTESLGRLESSDFQSERVHLQLENGNSLPLPSRIPPFIIASSPFLISHMRHYHEPPPLPPAVIS